MRFIIHVSPANLKEGPEKLPVWIVRPECAPEQSAEVFAVAFAGGQILTAITPDKPLPDTDGRGIAYLVTSESCRLEVALAPDSDYIPAETLFAGACSPWTPDPSLATSWGFGTDDGS